MTTLTALAERSLRIMGVVAGSETPEAEDSALAVDTLIALMAELPEYGAGRKLREADVAESVTADEDERLICSLGGITITLPALPADGARVAVVDVNASFAASNVTLARNNRKIAGTASNATLTTGGTWVYRADLADWKLVSTLVGASQSPYPESLDLAISHVLIPRIRTSFLVPLDPKLEADIARYEEILKARYTRPRSRDTRSSLPAGLNRSFFGNS